MAKSSTSFKLGNTMFHREKLGTFEYWTEENINKEILGLLEWVEREDSICMSGWRGENSITMRAVYYLIDKSPVFRDSYELARAIVANRLATKVGGKVHQVHYNKYQSYYDGEIGDYEKTIALIKQTIEEDVKKQAKEEAQATISAIHQMIHGQPAKQPGSQSEQSKDHSG